MYIIKKHEEDLNMLFRKKIQKSCSYCMYATKIDDGMVLCSKKGMKDACSKCRKFVYDPCKRIPLKAKTLDFSQYETEDFSL